MVSVHLPSWDDWKILPSLKRNGETGTFIHPISIFSVYRPKPWKINVLGDSCFIFCSIALPWQSNYVNLAKKRWNLLVWFHQMVTWSLTTFTLQANVTPKSHETGFCLDLMTVYITSKTDVFQAAAAKRLPAHMNYVRHPKWNHGRMFIWYVSHDCKDCGRILKDPMRIRFGLRPWCGQNLMWGDELWSGLGCLGYAGRKISDPCHLWARRSDLGRIWLQSKSGLLIKIKFLTGK